MATLLATLLLTGVAGLAQEPAGQGAANPGNLGPTGNQRVKPFKIIGNLYYVGMNDVAAYLFATPEGNILIDSTFEQTVPKIRESIEELGFKMRDIKILLNSHAHIDHVGGHKLMQELTGAKIYISAPDAGVVEDGGRSDFRNADGRERWKPVKVDNAFQDGAKVTLGGTTLTAHITPGHTKGCTTWTTTLADGGKNYNVVFLCGVAGYDGAPLINNPKYPSLADDYGKAFQVAKSLPCDIFLGFHARLYGLLEKMKKLEAGVTPNPFIDPQGYRDALTSREKVYRDEIEKERAAAR